MPVASVSSTRGRVLVTGSKGFTGIHLVPQLQRLGYSVVQHSEEQCDLRDATATNRLVDAARPDYVIHLASISFVPHGSPAEIYEVNTVGTTNLLDALVTQPHIGKVILASSSQVYGNSAADEIDETHLCRPANHYACSKLAMEHMAVTYCDRIPIVITRPFNYTGPGQPEHFLVQKIIAHFARRKSSIELGNTQIIRDFSDVRTVVDAYCRLLEVPDSGTTFNICSGVGRSLQWLLDEIGQLAGRQLGVEVSSELVRQSDVPRLVGTNRRLVDAIGPLKYVDLTATLRWMLEEAGAMGSLSSD